LRRGDKQALERVIDEYSGYVAAVVRHTLDDARGQLRAQDCEELVSDVFVALWRAASRLRADSRLKPWLAVAARNRALNWARERSRRIVTVPNMTEMLFGEDALAGAGAPGWSDALAGADVSGLATRQAGGEQSPPPEPLETLARDALITDALALLDEQSRRLMVGYYLEDQSIRELAEATGYSEPSIKSRLFRSRKLLKKYLQQEGF
jgi:RNA polymerase sigma-70 factor (ECF subfamily)